MTPNDLTLTPLHRVPKSAAFEMRLDGTGSLAASDPAAEAPPDGPWTAAQVPGFVQWQLFQAGEIPHPYGGLNSRELRWIEDRAWWFRRAFEVPADWAGRRLMLTFDGLDYCAQIFLNGRPIARHEGAFGGPDVDVTDHVRPGANELVVRLAAGGAGKGKPSHNGSGTIVKSEAFGRWTNNPDLMTVGVWRGVRLQGLHDITRERPFLRTLHGDDRTARLHLEVELAEAAWVPALQDLWGMSGVFSTDAGWQWRNGPVPTPVPLTVRLRFGEGAAAIVIDHAVTWDHRRQWAQLEFDVQDPQLWWPVGMGGQPLYAVTIELLHHWAEFNVGRFPPAMRRASVYDDLPSCSFADFREAIQCGSAETYETVARVFRSNYPVATLMMPWNFNRPWPTVAMQMVGRTVPGYHALERAYAPVCPAIVLPFENFASGESAAIDVRVVCEDPRSHDGARLRVRAFDHRLELAHEEDRADADGVLIARALQWPRVLRSFADAARREEARESRTLSVVTTDAARVGPFEAAADAAVTLAVHVDAWNAEATEAVAPAQERPHDA